MCVPVFAVLLGTNRNVSKPSNTDWNAWNLPPSSKFGLISENYVTEDVLELAMKMETNAVNDMIYNEFKKMERHSKKGIITFKAGKRPKHENEDPIRSGIEAMEICDFPCCKRTAKIKPLLKMTGAYCPFCGVKNYEIE